MTRNFFRGDIGRHWGTLGDLCPPRAPSTARKRTAGRAPQIYARLRTSSRDRTCTQTGKKWRTTTTTKGPCIREKRSFIGRYWPTLVDLCRPKPPVRGHNAMRGDSRTRRTHRNSTMPPEMTLDRAASVPPRPQNPPVRYLRPNRKRPEGKRPAALVRTAPVILLQRHNVRTRPQPYRRRRARDASWLPSSNTAPFTRSSSASSHPTCIVASVWSRTSSTQRATPARAVDVYCDHHTNQMNCSSDKCQQSLVVDVSPESWTQRAPPISDRIDSYAFIRLNRCPSGIVEQFHAPWSRRMAAAERQSGQVAL